MKPRNKEDVKPFDLELAKAGHPICQRGLLSARVGIWDCAATYYPLIGVVSNENGSEQSAAWTTEGTCYQIGMNVPRHRDLMLAPLGYCQDGPVFAGDVLIGPDGERIELRAEDSDDCVWIEGCTWPSKEPVMPTVKADEIMLVPSVIMMSEQVVNQLLTKQLDKVIDYLVESGKVVRV